MKVLVLGADGLLGHTLIRRLSGVSIVGGTVRGAAELLKSTPAFSHCRVFEDVNLTAPSALDNCLGEFEPDVVINCAGIVKQRPEAADIDALFAVNAQLPLRIAALSEQQDFRFIHVSSDCVFTGARGRYRESDSADAMDPYGASKRGGEPESPRSLTLRTSFIGRQLRGSHSLLEWLLNNTEPVLPGYLNSFFSGLSAHAVADEIIHIVTALPQLAGLYHLSGPRISKHDLIDLINQRFNCGKRIVGQPTPLLDRSLDDRRYRTLTASVSRTWPDMLDEISAESELYDTWRASMLYSERRIAP